MESSVSFMAGREITEESSFNNRLAKLIPGEFIAAYLAINNVLQTANQDPKTVFWVQLVSIGAMLVTLPFYQIRVLRVRDAPQIAATELSFALWVISIASPLDSNFFREKVFEYQPLYGTVAMVLWTLLLAPILIRKTA